VTWMLSEGALFLLTIKADQPDPIVIIRSEPACGREHGSVTFVSGAQLPSTPVLCSGSDDLGPPWDILSAECYFDQKG
jgi:hypothetical protein